MPRSFTRAAALAGCLLAVAAGVTCTESTAPKNGVRALVGLAPVFSEAAAEMYRSLVALDLQIDNVHVQLERADGSMAIDTTAAVAAGQDSVVLQLTVTLQGTSEEFNATIELRDGAEVLFSGTQTITAHAGLASPPPKPVAMEYAGPGATVTSLVVAPDTTISGLDDIVMRPTGRDANNLVVANLALTWSVTGVGLGTVTQAGVFQPTGTRGTAVVTAAIPTGVSGSATVTIVPPPTAVVLISGGGQTGTVGAALGSPFVVEVQAADGGPVPGQSVSFAVTGGGGSVVPTSATTGANGRASAVLTLGTAAGSNAVQVTVAGLTPISVSATGTPGQATKLAIAQQPSPNATSGQLLATQPKAQLQDAFGNSVATANVAVTADLNPSGSWTLQGTTTRNTNASGIADFTDLAISGPAGITALRFSGTSLTSVTSQDIAVSLSGPPQASWINGSGGNWSTGANWSTGVAPTSAEIAVIDLAGSYTVTLDVDATVAGLVLGTSSGAQTLAGTSRTLTLNGTGSIGPNGILSLTSSTLGGSGTLNDQGLLIAHGNTTLNATISIAVGGTLRAQGQGNGGTAALMIANGFTNNGLIELTSIEAGYTATLTVTNGTLSNASGATIHSAVGAGGSRTLAAQLNNQGTLDVDQFLSLNRASSQHVNSGTIDLTTANLTVTQTGTTPSFTNTGAVTLGANRDFTVSGGTLDLSAGTVSGTLTSTLVVNTATLAFSTTTVTIPLTLTSATIAGGSVTIPSGQTLTLLNGGLTDPVTVEAGGTLLTHGAVALTTVNLPTATSTLRTQGQGNGGTAALTVANGFTNNGLIELTSIEAGYTATLTVTAGALTNAAGATIHSAAGEGGVRTLAAQLYNYGTLDVDQGLTMDRASSAHYNYAAIDLTNANLTVNQTGTTPSFGNGIIGTITLGASRQFIVNGGSLDLIGSSTITGPPTSTLVVSNAVLQFTPPRVSIPMTLTSTTILGGSVTISTGQSLTLLRGGLSDPVSIESGGTLSIHGAVALTGTLTQAGTLLVQGQGNGGTAALTIANGFTNSGVIELTSIEAGYTSQMTVTTGTLTNGGIIHSALGEGGSRLLAAQLDNQSFVDVDGALTINAADAAHSNSGVIDLTNANLTLTQTASGSFTNTTDGSVTLGVAPLSRTWTVNGGSLDVDQGNINGPSDSKLVVNGAVLAFTPSNVTVPLTLTGGTTLATSTLTILDGETLTLLGGALGASVTVDGGGVLRTHGSVTFSGGLSVVSSGLLQVVGDVTGGTAILTVANSFTNAGTIELTSTDAGYTSQLSVTAGTLTNTGTIVSNLGATGTRILDAVLDNQGSLEVQYPLTMSRVNAAHLNNGTVDMTANLTLTLGTSGSFTNTSDIIIGATYSLIATGGTVTNSSTGEIFGTGTLNVAGTTFVNNGSLLPNAGAPGTLTVSGNYSQGATGSVNADISGATPDTQYDQVVVTGGGTLSGALNVNLTFTPGTNGQTFTIMTFGSAFTGTFTYTPVVFDGGTLQISYTSTQVILTAVIP